MNRPHNLGLIVAIVFASLAISGSLVFFGWQMQGKAQANTMNLDEAIQQGIQSFISKQEEDGRKAAEEEQKRREQAVGNVKAVSETDHIFGNTDAEISLIEYSDFDCPFCKRAHPTFKKLVEESNGKVNWIYRHYPLPNHDPSATNKAIAADCVAKLAGSDAFWKFTDKIFEDQGKIGIDEPALRAAAEGFGVKGAAFTTCFADEGVRSKIAASLVEGSVAGVSGTPGTIAVNNKTGAKRMIEGAQPYEAFQAKIEELRGAAKALPSDSTSGS